MPPDLMDASNINLRLLIPLAAGAALISSCAPGSSLARKYCREFKECQPDAFEDRYDSVGQCTKEQRLYLDASLYEWKIEEGPECRSAAKKVEKCRMKQLTCDAFIWYDDDLEYNDYEDYQKWSEDYREACEDEIDEYQDACGFDDPTPVGESDYY